VDGEHVRRHHLSERAWRSPCSLRPTATICRSTATVRRSAPPVCYPSTTAIFHAAAAKRHRLPHPHLRRSSPRAKVPFRRMF
jgi:hypothetical protein